jgi:hypothetical protein
MSARVGVSTTRRLWASTLSLPEVQPLQAAKWPFLRSCCFQRVVREAAARAFCFPKKSGGLQNILAFEGAIAEPGSAVAIIFA